MQDMSVRCLIVDDNPGFLQAARQVLEGGGFTVAGTASTSAEAVDLAGRTEPDVILVDVVLGQEDGFALAELLAARAGSARRKVILISTHAEEDFADLVAASPAIAFLPKWELSAAAVAALLAGEGQAGGG